MIAWHVSWTEGDGAITQCSSPGVPRSCWRSSRVFYLQGDTSLATCSSIKGDMQILTILEHECHYFQSNGARFQRRQLPVFNHKTFFLDPPSKWRLSCMLSERQTPYALEPISSTELWVFFSTLHSLHLYCCWPSTLHAICHHLLISIVSLDLFCLLL